jgi:hypothetical protein
MAGLDPATPEKLRRDPRVKPGDDERRVIELQWIPL